MAGQVLVHEPDGVTGLVARPEHLSKWWRVVGWTGCLPLVIWEGKRQPFPHSGVIVVTYEPSYWRMAR